MGSKIRCETDAKHKHHYNRLEYLISVADKTPLVCKECSGKLVYTTKQIYPNSGNEVNYILENARRIKEKYDRYIPLLLKLKSSKEKSTYWLQYWVKTKNKNGKESWKYGQYSPILTETQMKSLSELL